MLLPCHEMKWNLEAPFDPEELAGCFMSSPIIHVNP